MTGLVVALVGRFGWANAEEMAVAVLTSLGGLWVCVEILDYFFEGSRLVEWVSRSWWVFLLAGFSIGIVRAVRPMGAKISNTDIRVEIRIGDVFSRRFGGAVIIGSNATFDTSIEDGSISERSVQGQFAKRHFRSTVGELDERLERSLLGVKPIREHTKESKSFGKMSEFDLGTVAKVEGPDATAYFVAISRLNASKVAESSLPEYLDALPVMWEGIRTRGGQEDIVCPVLGTGLTRLPLNRMDAIRVLVRSFVAAAHEGKLTERFTVVVPPGDARHLDLALLSRWVHCECAHRMGSVSGPANGPVGTAA